MTTTFRRAGFPHVELADKLAAEIEACVQAGWFGSEAEVVRVAAAELIQRHRGELLERFMREASSACASASPRSLGENWRSKRVGS